MISTDELVVDSSPPVARAIVEANFAGVLCG